MCSAIKDREMKTPNRQLKTSIVSCSIMPLNLWGWGGLSTVVFCKQFSSCVAIGGLIPHPLVASLRAIDRRSLQLLTNRPVDHS